MTDSTRRATWRLPQVAGWAVSILPIAALAGSCAMKLRGSPEMAAMMQQKLGWDPALTGTLALLEGTSVALYAVPRTSVLGAVLLTGYLGGAIATHLRVGDNFAPAVVLGLLVWGGLLLREPRLRALLPLRRRPP